MNINKTCIVFCRLASRVVCATLAIPIPASRNHIDQLMEMDENAAEKQRRLATLLGLNSPPTRAQLVKDLVSAGFNPFILTPSNKSSLHHFILTLILSQYLQRNIKPEQQKPATILRSLYVTS